jgi:hypothetical protein
MKRPNFSEIDYLINKLHRDGLGAANLSDFTSEVGQLTAYIRHLEDQLDAVKMAARWQPGTRVWYRRAGGKRSIAVPGVVIAVRGQRVRVNISGPAASRVRDVSPASLRHPDKMSEWVKAATMTGLML